MAPAGVDRGGVEGQGSAASDVAPLKPNLYQYIPVEGVYIDFHEGGSQTSRCGARIVVLQHSSAGTGGGKDVMRG